MALVLALAAAAAAVRAVRRSAAAENAAGDIKILSASVEKLERALNAQLEQARESQERRAQEHRKELRDQMGQSFQQVSERLEAVQRGLGEMRSLASNVGDLKRVLTNVKTRGGWGEVQLEMLLSETLTAEQYGKNVAVKPDSAERVEFAIKLPGKDGEDGRPVYLPVDSKFPNEAYERLIEAADAADRQALEAAGKELEARIKQSAKDIGEKYVAPPHTTDFAIMYLPTEGLFAEAVRRPGLISALQNTHRIAVAGPTTFTALLNSLQMGFRTLAVERHSGKIGGILAQVKTEFAKFDDALIKVKKKLKEAEGHVDKVGVRSRAMDRALKDVDAQALPDADGGANVFALAAPADADEDEDGGAASA